MAVCMDDVLDNAIVEQTDELVALQSIYEDKFHLIRAYNKNENNRIEFNLTLSVRHPFERVTVEAVIPVNEPLDLPKRGKSETIRVVNNHVDVRAVAASTVKE
ncbi:hypothetical protein QZH41_017065 [Actinostola sp. cb2023]|nr:hypothetical protein QZH41_017065 [Actinostola sp. cb2023]